MLQVQGMEMEISGEERGLLLELLRSALGEVRVEVRHADVREFRDKLRGREDDLRGLIARLESLGG